MQRFSTVIRTPDEKAADIRATNVGQPIDWVNEAVQVEMDALAAKEAAAQASYDKNPPSRPYIAPEGA